MIERLRRLSPRAEKTIRLVVVCAVAAVLGILAGPLIARLLLPPEGSR